MKHLALLLWSVLVVCCIGQETGVVRPLEVLNADFEQGNIGWRLPKNGGLVQVDERHGVSARLVVSDPLTEAVYITRQLRVEPGKRYVALCELQTSEVVAAEGRMSSEGACLIVEWADANGQWMAPGAYSKKTWGTSGWTVAECRSLRAPAGAGYANIYLALRGRGCAWFDNFEFQELEEHAVKIFPDDGEVLATNAPCLQWRVPQGIDICEVELSRSAEFPPEATIRRVVAVESRLQLREPLDGGVWHWRVNIFGNPDPAPGTFTVAAAPGANCLPPEVFAEHARLLAATDQYVFAVKADGGLRELVVSDAEVPETEFETTRLAPDGQWQTRPLVGWRNGLNTIRITASGRNGVSESREVWVVCAPRPEKCVAIDSEGRYTENGERIFPLGIYQVEPEEMPEVASAGFEVVHSYRFESRQDDQGAREYLDAAAAAGLRVFLGFDRGRHSRNGIMQGNFEMLARRVGQLASHPGLFCWYLFDEPEVYEQYVPPRLLTACAELLRKLDPYHPVVMTTWGDHMNDYRRTWDTHWTQAYEKPAGVVATIAEHRAKLLNDSPITLLIHCYDKRQTAIKKSGEAVDWDVFEPDYDWMRAAALVGITQQINGLWWWWYAKSAAEWMTAAQHPRTWGDLCRVVEEVRSLRSVLNAEGAVQSGTVEVGEARVEWWMKTVAGKRTVIIVNTSETEVEATIAPQGSDAIAVKLGRFGVEVRR